MFGSDDKLSQLSKKLEDLIRRQDALSREMINLKLDVERARIAAQVKKPDIKNEAYEEMAAAAPSVSIPPVAAPRAETMESKEPVSAEPVKEFSFPKSGGLEKFIGENLINKIGILITVLGVGIGAKYAIDHNLISPLTRIIIGYIIGLGLMGFAIKLKKEYANFSAVLLSGAMAIFYFITFAAYNFYALIPQTITFGMMVLFTVFTAVAAIQYNMQVIALIGMVGAYAVPFLLSDGSGRVQVLFTYMAIINSGIMVLSFKKYWKLLYYSAFGITWAIYAGWHFGAGGAVSNYPLAMVFLPVFFLIFYVTFLCFKLIRKEQFHIADISLLLLNSFVFFGLGYDLLSAHAQLLQFTGLFSVINAAVHLMVATIVHRLKLVDKNLFYLIAGLVLVFLTIAVPIQLNGNWVTFLWTGEAVLLFTIGRRKAVPIYELLSYPLIILSFMSLTDDWSSVSYYGPFGTTDSNSLPWLNIYFLTALLVASAYAYIYRLSADASYPSALKNYDKLKPVIERVIGILVLYISYNGLRLEISHTFYNLYDASKIMITSGNQGYKIPDFDRDFLNYRSIALDGFTILFIALTGFLNLKRWKKHDAYKVISYGFTLVLLVLLGDGLYEISELRDAYLRSADDPYFSHSLMFLPVRYLWLMIPAFGLWVIKQSLNRMIAPLHFLKAFDLLLYGCVLWVLSSELIQWLTMAGSENSYKWSLSLLWGLFALVMVGIGIRQKQKHLRVGAISLFGFTLLKLFVYDLSSLNTISRTIVFVSLGILLLIISFLYNKYKHLIDDDSKA